MIFNNIVSHIQMSAINFYKDDLFFFEVRGFSMWPFIKEGKKLIIKKILPQELKIGDIVLYKRDDNLVCHRLVRKSNKCNKYIFYLRGDNSYSQPELISEEMVLGKAIGVIEHNRIYSLLGNRQIIFSRIIVIISPYISRIIRLVKKLLL
ncbi:MAG: signal peptidase I [Candidatus Omnitrophica bacterium]|nr:signal peptidase I [Candidatus Omnitrophota bacterium]